MRIEWTQKARAGFVRTTNFLRERSPSAAQRAYALIDHATQRLTQFPDSGRPYPRNPKRRELLVRFGNNRGYALLYLVKGDVVVILDFKDQRQGGY